MTAGAPSADERGAQEHVARENSAQEHVAPENSAQGQVRVVLALGSNLGDRLATLQESVTAIAGLPGTEILAVSPVYETAPVGGPAQPDYLNAVLIAASSLPAGELLAAAQSIERAFKRTREVRFGPRTLDIDVISYGDEVSGDPVLTLPHPRAHERAFVLAPWHDVDPDAELPGRGGVIDLLAGVGTDGVRRYGDVMLGVMPEACQRHCPAKRPQGLL
jgi:2-amino-4-hydroxy-6-hydroxymethyldihydropteridine diphosphokinase